MGFHHGCVSNAKCHIVASPGVLILNFGFDKALPSFFGGDLALSLGHMSP